MKEENGDTIEVGVGMGEGDDDARGEGFEPFGSTTPLPTPGNGLRMDFMFGVGRR